MITRKFAYQLPRRLSLHGQIGGHFRNENPWFHLCLGMWLAGSTASFLYAVNLSWIYEQNGEYERIAPWLARSENEVPAEGDRLRVVGPLPDGRRSRGRNGWGAVTTGFNGRLGLDLVFGPWTCCGSSCGESGRGIGDCGVFVPLWSCIWKVKASQLYDTTLQTTSASWHFFKYARLSLGRMFSTYSI